MSEEFEVKIGRVSLEGFSTAELVVELSKRDGVLQLHPDDAVRDLNEILWTFERNRQPRPKILVVREPAVRLNYRGVCE